MEQITARIWNTSPSPNSPSSVPPWNSTTIDLELEQVNAGWFIIVVIGFFALIIIFSMVVNQLNAEPVEDDISDYVDTLYQKKKSIKSHQKTPQCYSNQAYTDIESSTTNKSANCKDAKKAETANKKPAVDQDAVICITTVS